MAPDSGFATEPLTDLLAIQIFNTVHAAFI